MLVLGLAGQAGCGKDTVADYLVRRYGFRKFAFSDALYAEVAEAYGLEDQSLLRDRATKEVPTERLALKHLYDLPEVPNAFAEVAVRAMDADHKARGIGLYLYPEGMPLSPRQVLQWWGTEFRRAQDPDYWLKQTTAWLNKQRNTLYPEHAPQFFVNTTVRFPNEQEWIHAHGGNVWHIRRDSAAPVNSHVSEQPLEVLEGERELWNNDTIDRLHYGVDLLLSTGARFVRIEPMDLNSAA